MPGTRSENIGTIVHSQEEGGEASVFLCAEIMPSPEQNKGETDRQTDGCRHICLYSCVYTYKTVLV